MIDKKNAPHKGTIYATFVDKMVYERYENISDIEQYLVEDNLLELHLFNSEKEIRYIKTRGKGLLYCEISSENEGEKEYDDIYEETLYVSGNNIDKQENLNEKVIVVNYIKFDENDMLHIVNYRLKEVCNNVGNK